MHKQLCKKTKRYSSIVTQEEIQLIDQGIIITDNVGNPNPIKNIDFYKNFAQADQAERYVTNGVFLAFTFHEMAKKHNSGYLMNAGLELLLKMSRLTYLVYVSDIQKLIPFFLLELSRDADSYAFTMFWVRQEHLLEDDILFACYVNELTLSDMPAIHKICKDFNVEDFELELLDSCKKTAYYAALILLKARSINDHESLKLGLANFEQALSDGNHHLKNAMPAIRALENHQFIIPEYLVKQRKKQVHLREPPYVLYPL